MKKRVYITWSHHHVIKEWLRYQRTGVHLLSFDYHTDFQEAFVRKAGDPSAGYAYSSTRHKSYLAKHIPCQDVDAAIKDLRNDEHIDFAIETGMIEKAFVFSCDSSSFADERVMRVPNEMEQIGQARIFSYSEMDHPIARPYPYTPIKQAKVAKLVTTDEVLNEVIETFRRYGFNQANYILDFDCDFIRDKGAMEHDRFPTLKNLLNGAKAITIAREPDYVDKCSEHTLSCDAIVDWLTKLIKEDCGDDVEIIEE